MAKHFEVDRGFQVDTNGTLCQGLVSGYPMEGNSHDIFNSNDGTDTSVTYGTSYGKVNQGASFNGTSSKISIGVLPVTNTAFSLSCWVNVSTFDSSGRRVLSLNGDNLIIDIQASGVIQANYWSGSNYLTINATGNSTGTWYHVVYVQNGNAQALYINGVSKGTATATLPTLSSFTTNYIGSTGTSAYFQGDIDELYFWSKALSSQEIADLYNSGTGNSLVTSGYASGALIQSITSYWKFDETSGTTFADATGNGHTGTINSATIAQSGKVNDAFYLNNLIASNCPTIPASSAWQFGTGNFSFAFWIKAPSQTTYGTAIIGDNKAWVGGTGNPRFVAKYNWTGKSASYANQVQFDYYDASGTDHVLTSNSLGYSTWNHIAFIRNGDTVSLYQNGSLVTSQTGWGSYSLNIAIATYTLLLGTWSPDSGTDIQIYLDEFGIWPYAWGSKSAADLYNSGTGQTLITNTAYTATLSDSGMNASSRYATVGRVAQYHRTHSDSIMNGASPQRLATVSRVTGYVRNLSDSISNAANRYASVSKGIAVHLSDSIMNAAGRLATVSSLQPIIATASVAVSNAAGRFAKVTHSFIIKIGKVFRWGFSTWD